jgi:hypothetical protein
MKLVDAGIVVAGTPGTARACYTFPSVVALRDGTMLATARHGQGKDGDDEAIALFADRGDGRGFEPCHPLPPPPVLAGHRGTLKLAYLTELAPGQLLAAAMWVDRTAHPGQPLFNAATEGCLPMAILLARSADNGESWSDWRAVALPAALGPPSLTSPLFRLGNGLLAMSIETNKTYLDAGPWRQKAVLLTSGDDGDTWSAPLVSAEDPTGRVFNWDLRVAAAPDGTLVSFAWTYDRPVGAYRNIHRRISHDHGASWTPPQDIGIADQAGRPAILADGRLVLAWVDRFGSRSLRVRAAQHAAAPLAADSEIVLYALEPAPPAAGDASLSAALAEMALWSYGLPSATALPDGTVIVVYYAGSANGMDICWARLAL